MAQIFHNPFKEIPEANRMMEQGLIPRPLNNDPFIEKPEQRAAREKKSTEFWNSVFPEGSPYIPIVPKVPEKEAEAPEVPEAEQKAVERQKSFDISSLFAPQIGNRPGLPGFPEEELEEIAENEANVSRLRTERQNKAFQETQANLEKYTETLQGQIDLQNEKYNDWMQNDKAARSALDNLQSKYPTLTRAELMSNMSIGEKLTSSLLTLLGAINGAPPDKNPALAVLNRSLDEVIANQNLNYDRERKNILQTQLFNNQTFSIASSNIQAIGALNQNLLNNALALTNAKSSVMSEAEAQANAESAKNAIQIQIINSRLADQRARYELNLQERQYDFMRQTDRMERFSALDVPMASDIGNGQVKVDFQQSQGFFLNKDAKAKTLEANAKNVDTIKKLQFLEQAIRAGDKGEVRTQAAILSSPPYNIKLPDVDGWLVGRFTAKDLMSGGGAINNAMRTLSESSREILNNATFAPLGNQ